MTSTQPVPGVGDGISLADLTPETVGALVAVAGPGSGSPLVSVELRQLGGAVADESSDHGAVGAIDAGFALYAVGMAVNAEATSFIEARVDALKTALGPWAADRGYFNFSDKPVEGDSLYPPDTYRALQWVKAAYDPAELFRASHPIRPARPA